MTDLNYQLLAQLQHRVQVIEEEEVASMSAEQLRSHHNRLRSARVTLARAKGRHNSAEWDAIVAETGGICVRCGRPDHIRKAHIVPVAMGGTDAADNLMPLCASCCSARGGEQIDWLAVWRENQAEQARGTSNVTPITQNQSPPE